MTDTTDHRPALALRLVAVPSSLMISRNDVALRNADRDERAFDDVRGRPWIVYERLQGIGHYPVQSYLFFESETVVRRVCTYPRDWRALDVPALERLSWER